MESLGCLKYRAPQLRRKFNRGKQLGGVQVILTGFIDDSDESMSDRFLVGHYNIKLSPFQRSFVTFVVQANHHLCR
jgi:hypothetical protein